MRENIALCREVSLCLKIFKMAHRSEPVVRRQCGVNREYYEWQWRIHHITSAQCFVCLDVRFRGTNECKERLENMTESSFSTLRARLMKPKSLLKLSDLYGL